eukprot:GILI01014936.1.p1 GENE.GILI01014936.1~~GILI01014936.1.p1  ORF type:complete len:384 (-),score=57.34 GILI01014936.1:468-1619(-)
MPPNVRDIRSLGPASGGPSSQPRESPGQMLSRWYRELPTATRYVSTTISIIYIFSLIFPVLVKMFSTIPYYVLYEFQIWRVFLSPFIHPSIFTLLFVLLMFIPTAKACEASEGSLPFLLRLCGYSVLCNVLFLLLAFLLSFAFPLALLQVSSGLWPVLMVFIVVDCMRNPNAPRTMFPLPMQIPSKYIPLVFLFISLLFLGIELDFLAGLLIGYLVSSGRMFKFTISSQWLSRLQSSLSLRWFTGSSGYVPLDRAGGYEQVSQSDSASASAPAAPSSSRLAQGSFVLGGSSSDPPSSSRPIPTASQPLGDMSSRPPVHSSSSVSSSAPSHSSSSPSSNPTSSAASAFSGQAYRLGSAAPSSSNSSRPGTHQSRLLVDVTSNQV